MIDVSTIIINWNAKDYVLNCIATLLQEKANLLKEIIIDNGSQNGSSIEFKKKYPFIELIENKENVGFAKAVNQGLKIA